MPHRGIYGGQRTIRRRMWQFDRRAVSDRKNANCCCRRLIRKLVRIDGVRLCCCRRRRSTGTAYFCVCYAPATTPACVWRRVGRYKNCRDTVFQCRTPDSYWLRLPFTTAKFWPCNAVPRNSRGPNPKRCRRKLALTDVHPLV